MKFNALVLALAVSLLAAPLAAEAQPAGRVWRVGYLSAASAEFDQGWVAAFRRGLREAGYVEGKDIVVEQRHAAGRLERIPELATELVRLKVDVLVVYAGAGGVQAAKKVSSTIPIVMTTSADPVGTGLVASLARPGGNVTGLADAHGDLVSKRLELLKEIAPSVSRVAVLSSPTNPGASIQLKNLQAAAPRLNVTLLSVELGGSGPDNIDRAFSAIGQGRADALFIIPDPTFGARYRQIADLAVKSRLPAIATVRDIAAKITDRSATGPWVFSLVEPLSSKPFGGRQPDLVGMCSVTPCFYSGHWLGSSELS